MSADHYILYEFTHITPMFLCSWTYTGQLESLL